MEVFTFAFLLLPFTLKRANRYTLGVPMLYFLGIDGGGSETRAALITPDQKIVGRGLAGASNHYAVGAEIAAQNCASAAAAAIEDAKRMAPGFQAHEIVAWGFGLAGVRRKADADKMLPFLSEICGKPFILDTDAAAAWAGAFGGETGIVLSAGTGAICFGADEAGQRFYADGWGPLMGDEGGGYWMGVEALKAVCRGTDGRGPKTRLISPVLDAFAVPDAGELVRFVYSPACTREKIASLAKIVLDMAEIGSQEATDIRARSVALLARSVLATARELLRAAQERALSGAPEPLDLPIALRGGLFDDDFLKASLGYAISEAMIELKRDFLPIDNWRILKPHHDAAIGAALLAQNSMAA